MKEQIIISDLWKRYGENQVLKGLNLTIYQGETLVILGRSGVGKSVLLKHILGLEEADRGSITIPEENVSRGMLFQGGALFDSMSIEENTGFYLREHNLLSEEEIKQRACEALKMVGLEGTEEKSPSNLSGGMKKRAALARLIAYRPSILLYDEPTTGLDPITSMQINQLLVQIQKELHATSIVVTHDLTSALTVGDRLALHDDGKIAVVEEKSAFLKNKHPLIQEFLKNSYQAGWSKKDD